MAKAKFIRAMHPKAEIPPTREAIDQVLRAGWWGQVKIHGHRAQVHIPKDEDTELVVFNRQGQPHAKIIPPALAKEIRRLFRPRQGTNVIDAEWLKATNRLFVFDMLRYEDDLLDGQCYAERFKLLPRVYRSPYIETLGILKTTESCLSALASAEPHLEGLVFKAPQVRGFLDAAIVRCRKKPA